MRAAGKTSIGTVTPPAGGNTCWMSTSKAYDWLSPGMQKYLQGLTAVHSWEVSGFREALGQRGDDALIAAYIASGQPFGKAGGYAIQSQLAGWIPEVRGSYSAIMGLPLFETAQLLRQARVRF